MSVEPISAVNDFVIRFANVNGTGSASANGLLAKSFFRLGLPIGPKNMFPSNIQGLPTWYEVRVNENGFTGRRGGVDIMVAMNAQTLEKDIQELNPGGYLVFDSTRPLGEAMLREDIVYIGVPITDLTREVFSNPKLRAMLKNLVYVGAIAAMLGIDIGLYKGLIAEQFKKKPDLLNDNYKALQLGYDYCFEHYECPSRIQIRSRDLVKNKIIINGNEAAGLGCVYAGASVAAWYPITPSTSLVDAFAKYCERFRREPESQKAQFVIIQAEDEIASIGMVLGASWNGARAFTATSGPGVSLMSEFIGYAYYAEIPAVIFNVQRCGPSTGMPTRTQQADLWLCAYASHGDTKHILLFPASPKECFELAVTAFDLADQFQTPVFVMSDLELGMNDYLSDPLEWDEEYCHNRGKVVTDNQLDRGKFHRYFDVDGDGIPYRSFPGTNPKAAYFTRGSGHDRYGRYTEDGELYKDNVDRINRKFETARNSLPKPVLTNRGKGCNIGVLSVGTTAEPLREALDLLAQQGQAISDLRIRAFPFGDEIMDYIMQFDRVIVIEQNRDAQLKSLLVNEFSLDPERFYSVLNYDGLPITAAFLVEQMKTIIEKTENLI